MDGGPTSVLTGTGDAFVTQIVSTPTFNIMNVPNWTGGRVCYSNMAIVPTPTQNHERP